MESILQRYEEGHCPFCSLAALSTTWISKRARSGPWRRSFAGVSANVRHGALRYGWRRVSVGTRPIRTTATVAPSAPRWKRTACWKTPAPGEELPRLRGSYSLLQARPRMACAAQTEALSFRCPDRLRRHVSPAVKQRSNQNRDQASRHRTGAQRWPSLWR